MFIPSIKSALGMLLLLTCHQQIAASSLTKRGLGGDISDIGISEVNDSNGKRIEDSKLYKISPCGTPKQSLGVSKHHDNLIFPDWWDLKIDNSKNAIKFKVQEGLNFKQRIKFKISSDAHNGNRMNVNKWGIIQLDKGSGEVVFSKVKTNNCYKIITYNDQKACYFRINNYKGNAICHNQLSDGTFTNNAESLGRVTDSWMLVEA